MDSFKKSNFKTAVGKLKKSDSRIVLTKVDSNAGLACWLFQLGEAKPYRIFISQLPKNPEDLFRIPKQLQPRCQIKHIVQVFKKWIFFDDVNVQNLDQFLAKIETKLKNFNSSLKEWTIGSENFNKNSSFIFNLLQNELQQPFRIEFYQIFNEKRRKMFAFYDQSNGSLQIKEDFKFFTFNSTVPVDKPIETKVQVPLFSKAMYFTLISLSGLAIILLIFTSIIIKFQKETDLNEFDKVFSFENAMVTLGCVLILGHNFANSTFFTVEPQWNCRAGAFLVYFGYGTLLSGFLAKQANLAKSILLNSLHNRDFIMGKRKDDIFAVSCCFIYFIIAITDLSMLSTTDEILVRFSDSPDGTLKYRWITSICSLQWVPYWYPISISASFLFLFLLSACFTYHLSMIAIYLKRTNTRKTIWRRSRFPNAMALREVTFTIGIYFTQFLIVIVYAIIFTTIQYWTVQKVTNIHYSISIFSTIVVYVFVVERLLKMDKIPRQQDLRSSYDREMQIRNDLNPVVLPFFVV